KTCIVQGTSRGARWLHWLAHDRPLIGFQSSGLAPPRRGLADSSWLKKLRGDSQHNFINAA
ncbi:MAG: hypothetical protein DWI00_13770, partial [Planctomycetota bacterium]